MDGRKTNVRQVFVQHKLSIGSSLSSSAVSCAVRRAFNRTDFDLPAKGAHVLRHTLGARMVRKGVSIKAIADVLRHRHIDTSMIYTKGGPATSARGRTTLAGGILMKSKTRITEIVQQYLGFRRQLGYQLKIEGEELRRFGQFADKIGHQGPITIDLAVQWATLPEKGSRVYHARRLDMVRASGQTSGSIRPTNRNP